MKLRLREASILIIISQIFFFFSSCSKTSNTNKDLKIWYEQPAKVIKNEEQNSKREWLKALPLANVSLVFMVFGDVNKKFS